MEPLDSLNRWTERVRDRARMGTFFRFLAKRFLDDRLFQAAGSLAYTTLFALVPLAMVVFGVLSAFSTFQEWSDQLRDYIFANFLPGAAASLKSKLDGFLDNTGKLTAVGVIALVVSLLITLNSIEATFNRIWRVRSARPKLSRFLVYWTVLTLGALMAAASLALSARFYALPVFATDGGRDRIAVHHLPAHTAGGIELDIGLVGIGIAQDRGLATFRDQVAGLEVAERDRECARADIGHVFGLDHRIAQQAARLAVNDTRRSASTWSLASATASG